LVEEEDEATKILRGLQIVDAATSLIGHLKTVRAGAWYGMAMGQV